MSVLPVGFGSALGGYQIERSLRFNSADSAYLNRTPGSAPSNADIGTWSFWVKRTKLGVEEYIFGSRDGSNVTLTGIRFTSGDALEFAMFSGGTALARRITTQLFRDPSAWYHFVIVYNSPSATASERVRIYVNGVEITAFSTTTNPSQNQDLIRWAANGIPNYIGNEGTTLGNYGDYYLTETYYIDGQALTPSSFGETDINTGVWKPKAYTGTYGTNGFFLKFADNSNTTAATLGKDSSGNGNNFTPNNFSVTAGVGNDSLVDSPTSYGTDTGVGGEVRGNYCVLNSIVTGNVITPLNGNLNTSLATGANAYFSTVGTTAVSSGKWYWECTVTARDAGAGQWMQFGIVATTTTYTNNALGFSGNMSAGYAYYNDGAKAGQGTSTVGYGATFTTNDVIGIALDLDAGTLTFYKNGTSQGQAFSGISLTTAWLPIIQMYRSTGTTQSAFINLGQRPFEKWNGSAYVANTAPSGFKALCTQNLPPVTIGATSTTQANDYFNVLTYTGNGTDGRTVTGVGFDPDLVWVKGRSDAGAHVWADAVRGSNKNLYSNLTDAETNPITGASGGGIGTVTTDGFVLEQGTVNMDLVNTNTRTYVAWNWKGNGAGSSNTAGSITSTVSANTTSGFSIVTYTGTGANATVGHGLGATPAMIIVKNRDSGAIGGAVYHTSMGATKYLKLFQTTTGNDGEATDNTAWNGSSPTFNTNVFSVGSLNRTNSSQQMVAYCFAPVIGYSAFGSYTGNASADGPFVYLGFRPAYVLIKRSSATEAWCVMDFKREGYNVDNDPLFANLANAEGTQDFLDLLSNGFKLRSTDTGVNGSGTYIYAAFAESPFKYSLAR